MFEHMVDMLQLVLKYINLFFSSLDNQTNIGMTVPIGIHMLGFEPLKRWQPKIIIAICHDES